MAQKCISGDVSDLYSRFPRFSLLQAELRQLGVWWIWLTRAKVLFAEIVFGINSHYISLRFKFREPPALCSELAATPQNSTSQLGDFPHLDPTVFWPGGGSKKISTAQNPQKLSKQLPRTEIATRRNPLVPLLHRFRCLANVADS